MSRIGLFYPKLSLVVLLFFPSALFALENEYLPFAEGILIGTHLPEEQGKLSDEEAAIVNGFSESFASEDTEVRDKALKDFEKAADNGSPLLQATFGSLISTYRLGGPGLESVGDPEAYAQVEADNEKALIYLKRAYAGGEEHIANNIASIYYNGYSVAGPQYEKAFTWYSLAMDDAATARGRVLPAFNLGTMYDLGLGTDEDNLKAVEMYEIAARMGHRMALWNLGLMYESGEPGVPASRNRAVEMFAKASAGGYEKAVYRMLESYPLQTGMAVEVLLQSGQLDRAMRLTSFFYGKGLLRPSVTLIDAMETAALTDPVIREILAERFLVGDVVDQDPMKAYEIAIGSGERTNDNDCQAIFIGSVFVDKEPFVDAENMSQVIDTGIEEVNGYCLAALAQVVLENENITEEDIVAYIEMMVTVMHTDEQYASTYAWERMMAFAENGIPHAQFMMGKVFLVGEIVAPDTDKAVAFLQGAADSNHLQAAGLLAEMK